MFQTLEFSWYFVWFFGLAGIVIYFINRATSSDKKIVEMAKVTTADVEHALMTLASTPDELTILKLKKAIEFLPDNMIVAYPSLDSPSFPKATSFEVRGMISFVDMGYELPDYSNKDNPDNEQVFLIQ